MQKIIVALAALATLGIALPYAAPAKAEKTVIIKHGSHVAFPPQNRHHQA